MTKRTPEELEKWLSTDPKPDAWYSRRDTTNRMIVSHRTNIELLDDCLEAAKSPGGQKEFVMQVKGEWGQVPFLIGYTISDVTIMEVCSDGHTYTDWQYDFTGGDIRTCKVCGLKEFS